MSTEDIERAELSVDVEHGPQRVSSILAVAAGLLAVLSSGIFSGLALLFGFLGLVGLAGGLFALESRRAVTVSTGLVFVAVLLSGFQGNTAPFLVVSTIATILAFDLGQNAFSLGHQMTADTRTQRGEFVHAAATVVVGTLATIVAYLIYLVSDASILGGSQPASKVLFLLFGAVLVVWAIRA